MTGVVNQTGARSGIVGTNVGTPAGGATSGMISNVYKFSDVSSGTQTNTGTTTKYVAQDANSFAGVSGRHYVISGVQPCSPRGDGSTSNVGRFQTMRLYYGTTDRSIGDTTLDTSIFGENILIGRNISAASTNTALGLLLFTYIAYFTAGSTATHYVYTVVSTFSGSTSRAYNDADNPHKTIVFEVMP